jgi:hypothetical protein
MGGVLVVSMELITNPDGFFREMKHKKVQILKPAVILILLAILLAIYQYGFTTKLAQVLPEDISKFFMAGAIISIVGAFIGVFAIWLLVAAMMHGMSALFDGVGSFRRTFEYTGYGFLPSLIGSLITVPASAYYISQAEVPRISFAQLQQNPNVVKEVIFSLLPKDLIYSNLLINFAVTIWSLVIWSFAVKHAREIELRKAFICASIPTVLFTMYHMWGILKLF